MEESQGGSMSEILTTQDRLKADAHDYRLITKASEEFDRGNYDGCIEMLEQLEALKDNDLKLQHNKAVAKFYKSSCRDYNGFLKSLDKLKLKEVSTTSTGAMRSTLPFLVYNKAIIFYHRHMYRTALNIIEPLFENIETYNDNILAILGVLELRLLLASNQVKKALAFLELLLQKLGISLLNLTTSDECNSQEVLTKLDNKVIRNLKLMSLLTHVVNKTTVLVPEDGSPEFSALKAHQYYIMKDFQMASKQLKKINVSGYMNGTYNQELNTLIANNMGVIHLRVRHYAIAANFFQNAINFDKHISANLRDIDLHHMSSAKSCEILYNLGIALLHLRRPREAFQCFLVPLKTYHSNPRLWFRIAESCIMEHEIRRLEEKSCMDIGKSYLFSNRISYLESNQSSAVLEPTMSFAALCLRNTLTLTKFYLAELKVHQTNEEIINNMTGSENIKWQSIKENSFFSPSGPITEDTFYTLLSSVYAAYSYVSLRLGDYATALKMAEDLLKMETLSDAHKMLAHMYAGEALIMMEKLSDAKTHLEPTLVSNLNTFDFETKDWQVKSLDAAQNVARYNFAIAMFLQGDIEVARGLLNTCTHPIVSRKVQVFKTIQSKCFGGNTYIV